MLPALLLIATLVVVGLLVVVLFRMGGRFDGLRDELERLRVVQRDMSSDVRARLDEGARSWESVEAEVRPRLDQLEPSVADLSASLDEHLPALATAHKRLEEVEARATETEARVVRALETGSEEDEERFERIEAAVRTLRNAADERIADLAARVGALEAHAEAVRLAQAAQADEAALAATGEHPGLAQEAADAESEEDASLEPVAMETRSAAPRGTGSARKGTSGRWVVVVLVLVTGLAIALLS